MASRIFVSYHFQDQASRDQEYAIQLVEDLQAAGADVVMDGASITDEHIVTYLNDVLPTCDWLIYIQTPEALQSSRVQLAVNTALSLVVQKRMQGVFQMVAAPCDLKDIPPTWATLRKFDATQDYARALTRLLLALNLGRTHPASYGTPPPLVQSPISPPMAEDRPTGLPVGTGLVRSLDTPSSALEEREMDRPSSTPPVPSAVVDSSVDQIDRPKSLPQKRNSRRQPVLISALLLLLVTIIVLGSFAYALHGLSPSSDSSNRSATAGTTSAVTPNTASSATVTITPANSALEKTYNITAVTEPPDATKHQVQARLLSSTTQPQSQNVSATGQGTTAGTQAHGILTFANALNPPVTFNAGSVFPNDQPTNIQMMLDQTVTVPGPNRNNDGIATAPAHVVQTGVIGNVRGGQLGMNNPDFIHVINNTVQIYNVSDFTGGQDPQSYSFVQQSDIDGAANTLEAANTPNPDQLLQRQVQSNERMIGSPQCKPNVTSDYKAGDKATSVAVSVSFTCTGEVYDVDGALALGANLLKDQANTDLGAGYNLVGNVVTTLTNAAIVNSTISLTVDAKGSWVYQLSDADKQNLSQEIAGKSKQEAQTLLLAQKGVAQVNIQIVGGDGKTLPTDPGLIKIL